MQTVQTLIRGSDLELRCLPVYLLGVPSLKWINRYLKLYGGLLSRWYQGYLKDVAIQMNVLLLLLLLLLLLRILVKSVCFILISSYEHVLEIC